MRKFKTAEDRRRAKFEALLGESLDNLQPAELEEERKLLRGIGKAAAIAGGAFVALSMLENHGAAGDIATFTIGAFLLGESIDIHLGEAEIRASIEPRPKAVELPDAA